LVGKQPIVLLKTAEGNKFLPIWIGHPEAAAILMKLQSQAPPRPMTHDLLSDVLEQLGAQIIRITVTELRENTFYAQITVVRDGQEIEVDSRPSDAIALAIRAEAPIYAAERVIEESAIEFEGEEVNEEEIVSEFKQFLEQVTPDEFAVESRAPLTMPPDFNLRPPQPGALGPQEKTSDQQARQVIEQAGPGEPGKQAPDFRLRRAEDGLPDISARSASWTARITVAPSSTSFGT